jgi:hypothetical protein
MAALLLGTGGARLMAQDTAATAADTAAPVADTVAPLADTAAPVLDTAGTATAAPGARQDSMRPAGAAPDTARTTARPAPPPAPVDSALAVACSASGGETPALLAVTFGPTVSEAERRDAAREAGVTLVGPAQHQAPGAWYVQVSAGTERETADRLIVLPPVVSVEALRCP